ncbi:hypothetical protein FXO38_21696 [Capsicum annuum]|nr:hypothetical protein FXO37_29980 [Capsicum annuum]KAF3641289.1 hypothetical protein FXO38_21696 [Capsicum annuum]
MSFLFIIVIASSRDIFARNDLSSERPYVEPSLDLGYEDCNASLIPNGSMAYPSLLYQHQVNASRLQLGTSGNEWCIFYRGVSHCIRGIKVETVEALTKK